MKQSFSDIARMLNSQSQYTWDTLLETIISAREEEEVTTEVFPPEITRFTNFEDSPARSKPKETESSIALDEECWKERTTIVSSLNKIHMKDGSIIIDLSKSHSLSFRDIEAKLDSEEKDKIRALVISSLEERN
jgi:hypothetical protein